MPCSSWRRPVLFLMLGLGTSLAIAGAAFILHFGFQVGDPTAPRSERAACRLPSVDLAVYRARGLLCGYYTIQIKRPPVNTEPRDLPRERAELLALLAQLPPEWWAETWPSSHGHYDHAATDADGWHGVQAWFYYGAGWPLRCLGAGSYVGPGALTTPLTWGTREIDLGTRWISIPTAPIWSGLLADTLVLALAWWGAWAGLCGVRAARRRRHGHCPRCAYDLRADFASGCPECGWGRAAP